MATPEDKAGSTREAMLRSLYDAFNRRDVDACLAAMTPDVNWANGWEGGEEHPDGRVEVTVHLLARDKTGTVVNDSTGRHVYDFRGGLIERMTIED